MLIDGGAYRQGGENSMVGGCYQKLYACENVRTEQRQYYSNSGPSVAFRAPGYVEGTFALEQAMDELARRLDLDPFELRERNYTRVDQKKNLPYSSPDALQRCYAAARQVFGWPRRPDAKGEDSAEEDSSRRRGIGMAASVWQGGGANPPASAQVSMASDGTVTVHTGTQDIGTGTRTVLAQIAAGVLCLPLDHIQVHLGDTGMELHSPSSAGSATLPTVGPAVHGAATALRQQLLEAAAEELDCAVDSLELERAVIRGPEKSLSLAELAGKVQPDTLRGQFTYSNKPDEKSLSTFAVQCAEVEVDTVTGEITVRRLVCAPDCGALVNPMLAESQIIGGVTQGTGFALCEGRVSDSESGLVLNANLEDYLIPTLLDIPSIEHASVELPDRFENSLGVKGLGEPPMIATAPAIANAVHDALGVRLRDLPMDRRSLIDALRGEGATR